jgi:riboflavin kinase/FMN adenylyltransferase
MSLQVTFGFPAAGTLADSHATIGTYDGVHRGHVSLLKPLVEGAGAAGARSVVVTFEPHPRCVLDPDNCPANLTTLDEKTWLLEQLGIDHVIVLPFTRQVAALSPATFMGRLTHGMKLRRLTVGYDFAFGQGRRGDHAFLTRLAGQRGFTLTVGTALSRGGSPISSSRIRHLLVLGNVRAAADLLGRDYFLRSVVEHGTQTGHRIGFPTANLKITPNKLLPANGVYAIRVLVDGVMVDGVLNAGFRPTFGGNVLTVEAFLFAFQADLYGKLLTVYFVQRLRDEKRFPSPAELQAQIARDVAEARRILAR